VDYLPGRVYFTSRVLYSPVDLAQPVTVTLIEGSTGAGVEHIELPLAAGTSSARGVAK
jgi:hypothetical protein